MMVKDNYEKRFYASFDSDRLEMDDDVPSYIGIERRGPKIYNPRPYDDTSKKNQQKPTNTRRTPQKPVNEKQVRDKVLEEAFNNVAGVRDDGHDMRADVVQTGPSPKVDNSERLDELADKYANEIDNALPTGSKFKLTRESVLNLVRNAYKRGFNERY